MALGDDRSRAMVELLYRNEYINDVPITVRLCIGEKARVVVI